jgi:hypothetical protein
MDVIFILGFSCGGCTATLGQVNIKQWSALLHQVRNTVFRAQFLFCIHRKKGLMNSENDLNSTPRYLLCHWTIFLQYSPLVALISSKKKFAKNITII